MLSCEYVLICTFIFLKYLLKKNLPQHFVSCSFVLARLFIRYFFVLFLSDSFVHSYFLFIWLFHLLFACLFYWVLMCLFQGVDLSEISNIDFQLFCFYFLFQCFPNLICDSVGLAVNRSKIEWSDDSILCNISF